MATVINNPERTVERRIIQEDNSGVGVMVGVLLVIALIAVLVYLGLPYLRNINAPAPANTNTGDAPGQVNITLPSVTPPPSGADNSGGNSGANTSPGKTGGSGGAGVDYTQ